MEINIKKPVTLTFTEFLNTFYLYMCSYVYIYIYTCRHNCAYIPSSKKFVLFQVADEIWSCFLFDKLIHRNGYYSAFFAFLCIVDVVNVT